MHEIALSLGLADHEHVQVTHDRRAGLSSVVAIHSTALELALHEARRRAEDAAAERVVA